MTIRYTVAVKPNSKETRLVAFSQSEKTMTIALQSEEKKGKVNEELLRYLKKRFHAKVRIISGKTSRNKIIAFD